MSFSSCRFYSFHLLCRSILFGFFSSFLASVIADVVVVLPIFFIFEHYVFCLLLCVAELFTACVCVSAVDLFFLFFSFSFGSLCCTQSLRQHAYTHIQRLHNRPTNDSLSFDSSIQHTQRLRTCSFYG